MLPGSQVKQMKILDACHEYDQSEEQFRKILIKFLQLESNPQTCKWLANKIGISPSTIIEFTQEGKCPYPALRKAIIETIQYELFYILKF